MLWFMWHEEQIFFSSASRKSKFRQCKYQVLEREDYFAGTKKSDNNVRKSPLQIKPYKPICACIGFMYFKPAESTKTRQLLDRISAAQIFWVSFRCCCCCFCCCCWKSDYSLSSLAPIVASFISWNDHKSHCDQSHFPPFRITRRYRTPWTYTCVFDPGALNGNDKKVILPKKYEK